MPCTSLPQHVESLSSGPAPTITLSGHPELSASTLALAFTFGIDRVSVAARGDLDILSATVLGAVLDALVRDPTEIVLDLADLEFMDAAGLGVIAHVAHGLRSTDRRLTILAPSALVVRLLEITDLAGRVTIDQPRAAGVADGDLPARSRRIAAAASLAGPLARVHSALPDDVIDASLRLVIGLASQAVDGADGVSVTLHRNGAMRTVAATNDTVLQMDHHQYDTGEGPCLAAAAEGHSFHIRSLATEPRWPRFVPRALDEVIASILSTPLITAAGPVGALNIYSTTEGAFGARREELAGLFAAQASGILAGGGEPASSDQMADRVAIALTARDCIARAQGILMARHHVSADDAAAQLHRTARQAGIGVVQLATDLIAASSTAGPPGDEGEP